MIGVGHEGVRIGFQKVYVMVLSPSCFVAIRYEMTMMVRILDRVFLVWNTIFVEGKS